MSDLNNLIIQGRVVKDVEIKTSEKGTLYADFSIAVNTNYKRSSGEWETSVDFFPITIFGDYASMYGDKLTKGRSVIVEGKLKQSKWEQDGKQKSKLSIVVSKLHLANDTKRIDSSSENDNQETYETEYDFSSETFF